MSEELEKLGKAAERAAVDITERLIAKDHIQKDDRVPVYREIRDVLTGPAYRPPGDSSA